VTLFQTSSSASAGRPVSVRTASLQIAEDAANQDQQR
jgi:hypothetical protein